MLIYFLKEKNHLEILMIERGDLLGLFSCVIPRKPAITSKLRLGSSRPRILLRVLGEELKYIVNESKLVERTWGLQAISSVWPDFI